MGSNFEKTILILNGDKTKSDIAIKELAVDLLSIYKNKYCLYKIKYNITQFFKLL